MTCWRKNKIVTQVLTQLGVNLQAVLVGLGCFSLYGKKSNPDQVITSKICYSKQRHPSPYMVWVLAVACFDQIQINQEFFPLSQHLFWQSLHLWLVLESLVAVPSWKECPSWDLVNSSIHKSSCPPPFLPPAMHLKSPGYLCNLSCAGRRGEEHGTARPEEQHQHVAAASEAEQKRSSYIFPSWT